MSSKITNMLPNKLAGISFTNNSATDNMSALFAFCEQFYNFGPKIVSGDFNDSFNNIDSYDNDFVNVNFAKKVIDKISESLTKNIFSIKFSDSDYIDLEQFLLEVWYDSDIVELSREIIDSTMIVGTNWIAIDVKDVFEEDVAEGAIKKVKVDEKIMIRRLNYFRVIDMYKELGYIEFFSTARARSNEPPPAYSMHFYGATKGANAEERSIRYFDDKILYIVNGKVVKQDKNPYGFIPIVKIKNDSILRSKYGRSEIIDIIELNIAYAKLLKSLSRIVAYHMSPILAVWGIDLCNVISDSDDFGANARLDNLSLEKRHNTIINSLPEETKFEYIQWQGNIEATLKFLEIIKSNIEMMAGMKLSDEETSTSHTSGSAIAMSKSSLANKIEYKQTIFAENFRKINNMILKVKDKIDNKFNLKDYPEYKFHQVVFSPAYKRDRSTLISDLLQLLDRNITSPEDVLNELGYDKVKEMLERAKKYQIEKGETEAKIQAESDRLSAEATGGGMDEGMGGQEDMPQEDMPQEDMPQENENQQPPM